jgi:hypothetical protein
MNLLRSPCQVELSWVKPGKLWWGAAHSPPLDARPNSSGREGIREIAATARVEDHVKALAPCPAHHMSLSTISSRKLTISSAPRLRASAAASSDSDRGREAGGARFGELHANVSDSAPHRTPKYRPTPTCAPKERDNRKVLPPSVQSTTDCRPEAGVLLNHPNHVQRMLQTNHRNYRLPPLYRRLRLMFGGGIPHE